MLTRFMCKVRTGPYILSLKTLANFLWHKSKKVKWLRVNYLGWKALLQNVRHHILCHISKSNYRNYSIGNQTMGLGSILALWILVLSWASTETQMTELVWSHRSLLLCSKLLSGKSLFFIDFTPPHSLLFDARQQIIKSLICIVGESEDTLRQPLSPVFAWPYG